MILAWYIEFIKSGWKKTDFDKQFERVKRLQIFNRLDIADWYRSDETYNEIDLNVAVDRKINHLIQRGEFLQRYGTDAKLTANDLTSIKMAVATKLKFVYQRNHSEAIEKAIAELTDSVIERINNVTNKTG